VALRFRWRAGACPGGPSTTPFLQAAAGEPNVANGKITYDVLRVAPDYVCGENMYIDEMGAWPDAGCGGRPCAYSAKEDLLNLRWLDVAKSAARLLLIRVEP
jgi:hypothetical protein